MPPDSVLASPTALVIGTGLTRVMMIMRVITAVPDNAGTDVTLSGQSSLARTVRIRLIGESA